MKTVKATIKLEFEIDDDDQDLLKEEMYSILEDKMSEDTLFDEDTTFKVLDEDEEDEENEE